MGYDKTWLYKSEQFEEAVPNGCIIAFNPTRSLLLQRQVEAIASELGYDYHVYNNLRTDRKILEAANQAYYEGYENLFVLTESDKLTHAEQLIESYFDFNEVLAFAEVVSSPKVPAFREAYYNAQPLMEGAPARPATIPTPVQTPTGNPGSALLIVAALNAFPVKGMGNVFQEILGLERNAASYVTKYLPGFTTWDKRTVYVRTYIRPSDQMDARPRIELLADGGNGVLGLYDAHGCGATKVNPPLESASDFWILGDRRSKAVTKIQSFTQNLNIGKMLIFAPQQQVQEVQGEFDGASVIPLSSSVNDTAGNILQLAFELSNTYSAKNLAAQKNNPSGQSAKAPTAGDYFAFQLLHIAQQTGGKAQGEEYDSSWKTKKGYIEGIWAALPEADREFLKEVGSGTGIGDIIDIANSLRRVGKAALGMDPDAEKKKKTAEHIAKIEEKLGFGIAEVMNDPKFQQLKGQLDLAD